MPCCPPSPQFSSASAASSTAQPPTPKVHLHVHVADLGVATAFYRALFGADPVKEHPGYAKFLPEWAPVNLALSEYRGAVRGNTISHLGIQLGSSLEVDRHLHRVRAAGLPVRVEVGVDCCHANQDKFWVQDPSGIEWEVYHLNHDLPDAGAACVPDGSSSCCPA